MTMKLALFSFAFMLAFTSTIRSQDYVPFPVEHVHWNVFYAGTCQEKAPDTTILRYAFHGDTIIKEELYRKLCLESGDTLNPKIRAIGGIREENKQIFYNGETIYTGTGDSEYLLYDFTKQVGDTIKHRPQRGYYSVVLGIDSVWVDGVFRKRYEVDNHWVFNNPDYIIEGIGSVKNGLLGHISDIPTCGTHYWEFICFREDNGVLYLNPSFSGCFPDFLFMGTEHSPMEHQIKVYPNPIDQTLYVENNTNTTLSLKITDGNGRTILNRRLDEPLMKMDLDVIPGIYHVAISNKEGKRLVAKKIIRQ
jgi:hypothetical protein